MHLAAKSILTRKYKMASTIQFLHISVYIFFRGGGGGGGEDGECGLAAKESFEFKQLIGNFYIRPCPGYHFFTISIDVIFRHPKS